MWEVHEIFRKLILCGMLVYLPERTRAAIATLVCVGAVASLNYFVPPRNKTVFWIMEAAFLSTTFKYIGVVLMNVSAKDERAYIATILIALDVLVMLGSLGMCAGIICNLKQKMGGKSSGAPPGGGGGGGGTLVHPAVAPPSPAAIAITDPLRADAQKQKAEELRNWSRP